MRCRWHQRVIVYTIKCFVWKFSAYGIGIVNMYPIEFIRLYCAGYSCILDHCFNWCTFFPLTILRWWIYYYQSKWQSYLDVVVTFFTIRICRRISLCRPNSVQLHWKLSCSPSILRAFTYSWNALQLHRFSLVIARRDSTCNAKNFIRKFESIESKQHFQITCECHKILESVESVLSIHRTIGCLSGHCFAHFRMETSPALPILVNWIAIIFVECHKFGIWNFAQWFSGIRLILMRSYRTFSIFRCCTFSTRSLDGRRLVWTYRLTPSSMDFWPSLNTNWKWSVIDFNTRTRNSTRSFGTIGRYYSEVVQCNSYFHKQLMFLLFLIYQDNSWFPSSLQWHHIRSDHSIGCCTFNDNVAINACENHVAISFHVHDKNDNNRLSFVQLPPGSIEFWTKVAYLNSIFFQMSVFCYLGNEITFTVSDKLISLLTHQNFNNSLFHGSSVHGSIDECVPKSIPVIRSANIEIIYVFAAQSSKCDNMGSCGRSFHIFAYISNAGRGKYFTSIGKRLWKDSNLNFFFRFWKRHTRT